MSGAPSELLSIEGLTVEFPALPAPLRCLSEINLSLAAGERLGVVGESGSGKSITWLAALGLLSVHARVSGSVRLHRMDILGAADSALAAIRGRRIAMIFQDATGSLNPLWTIGRQIIESLHLHRGMTGHAAWAEAHRLLERVGIADPAQRLEQYPHELSGGMNQRVMIAMALAGQPDLLIADEPTTALDPTVQAQILALLDRIVSDTGMALVFISHDIAVVSQLCERIVVMHAGRIVEDAQADSFFEAPRHPYSRQLLQASRRLAGRLS